MQTIWSHAVCPPPLASSGVSIGAGTLCLASKAVVVANPLHHFSWDPFGQSKALHAPREPTSIMKLSHNGRFLALASEIVNLMDLERGKVVRQFTDHTNTITGITTPTGSAHIWSTVAQDRTIRIFDSRQHPGQILCRRTDGRYRAISYAPNATMIFCGGDNVCIFDIRMNSELSLIKTGAQVTDLVCHPEDCVVLGCTDDRMVKIWDIETHECITQSYPLDGQPQRAIFEPDGRTLVACTSQTLYTIEWEPFNVKSSCPWSQSKPSQFMVMDGEEMVPPGALVSGPTPFLDTLDIKFEGDTLLHLGYAPASGILEIRSISTQRLLSPTAMPAAVAVARNPVSAEPEDIGEGPFDVKEDISPTSPLSEYELPTTFTPLMNSTMIHHSNSDRNVVSMRKMPRSTSTSRSLKVPVPKKTASSAQTTPNARSRSSSTHSLHSTVKRELSADKRDVLVRSSRTDPRPVRSTKPPVGRTVLRGKSTSHKAAEDLFDTIMNSHKTTLALVNSRKDGIKRVKGVMRRGDCEDEVLSEAIQLTDKTLFAHLLLQHGSRPMNLKFAVRVLPELRSLLSHPNADIVDTAITVLDAIVTQVGDSIRQGIAGNAQSLGVDVAAEERQMRCSKCREALVELYVNSHFIRDRLSDEQELRFKAAFAKVDDLVS